MSHHAKLDGVNWIERGFAKSIERLLMHALGFDLTLDQQRFSFRVFCMRLETPILSCWFINSSQLSRKLQAAQLSQRKNTRLAESLNNFPKSILWQLITTVWARLSLLQSSAANDVRRSVSSSTWDHLTWLITPAVVWQKAKNNKFQSMTKVWRGSALILREKGTQTLY